MMLNRELFAFVTLAVLAVIPAAVTSQEDVFNSVLGLPVRMITGRSSEGDPFGRTTSCAKACPGSSTFSYQNNMVHVFDYHSSAKLFGGIQEPQMAVTARAHITVAGPCEMILALSHVRLTGTSSSSATEFAASLTSTPLRFAFHDGRVSNICPSTEEPIWVLNFKRAVLSTFQNTMGNIESSKVLTTEEHDVSGSCTSQYKSVQTEPGVFNITRTRIDNCVSRPVPSSNCKVSALLQLVPVFNKEQTCYQKISGGVMKESICREYIRYPEFLDTPERLPIIAVSTTLTLAYQFKADFVVIPNYNATRATLLQDWEPRNTVPPSEWMNMVENILGQFEDIVPSPNLFYGLTEILKNIDYNQIQDLFINAAPQLWNTAAMSFVSTGSEPAMKLLVDLMEHGVLRGSRLADTVEYLAKRFDMNSPMLDMILKVIQNDRSSDSSVQFIKVKNYCDASRNTCEQDERIEKIQRSIDKKIRLKCKDPNSGQENADPSYEDDYASHNIEHLNILRDFGSWNPNVSLDIEECIQSNISEVRYAALQTIRRSPCDQYDYSSLLLLWQKPDLDKYTQVMIYKALARCPTEMLKEVVRQKILLEEVTQVTSYIWSHLSNFEDQPWTAEILSDARLNNKFTKEELRFSRHYRKDVKLSNKTFQIEFDVIFSGFRLGPQYKSIKITTKDFYPNNVFEIEMREKNETRNKYSSYDYDYSTDGGESSSNVDRYHVTEARMFGYVIYSKESNMDEKIALWSMDELYSAAFVFGYKIIASTTIEYLYQFFSRISSVNYLKVADIQLRYPTTMGVPINLKLNMTTGSHEGTLLLAAAKNLDAQLSIDATHAQIGCKLKASAEFFPKLKASTKSDKLQLYFTLPDERNSLINVEYDMYTFENDQLTPKFYSNETEFTSLCIPALQEFTGFTFCFDYYPRTRYWPIYTFKYGLSYQRDPSVEGIVLSYNSDDRDNLIEICLETPGSPSSTWKISKYELAQFVSVNLTTPFFKLNGSGTYKEDALFLEEPGQGVNISGIFEYRGDRAPFVLINNNEVDKLTNKTMVTVDFLSSLLSTNLVSSFKSGENGTFNLNIPYQFKEDGLQRFKVALGKRRFNITSNQRYNFQTENVEQFTRWIYSASVGLSKYKNPLITFECVDDEGEHVYSFDTHILMADTDKSLDTKVSYVGMNDTYHVNCSTIYKAPKSHMILDETMRINKESCCLKSHLVYNNDTIYTFEAKYSNMTGNAIQSNATLLVPNYEDDAKYPIMNIVYDQKFNFTGQNFYTTIEKIYYDESMSFNVSMKRATDNILRPGYKPIHYAGDVTFLCTHYDPFNIGLKTEYIYKVDGKPDFTMNANIRTPFDRWNKDALDVKLETKNEKLKASITDKRFSEQSIYNLEGITDYDIVTNMVDCADKKFGKPIAYTNEI